MAQLGVPERLEVLSGRAPLEAAGRIELREQRLVEPSTGALERQPFTDLVDQERRRTPFDEAHRRIGDPFEARRQGNAAYRAGLLRVLGTDPRCVLCASLGARRDQTRRLGELSGIDGRRFDTRAIGSNADPFHGVASV
jgi:hypothetical protein